MVKLSVIVPVYNVEKYLAKCLHSIVKQTFRDIEIIIINDGSTDNCQSIIEEYAIIDNRIKVINSNNNGLSAARNLGLSIATGEYITFVDSDDFIVVDMYNEMLKKAEQSGADITVSNYSTVQGTVESGSVLSLPNKIVKINEIGIQCFILKYFLPYKYGCEVWNKVYKRKLISDNDIMFFPNREIFAEDWLFNLSIFLFAEKVATVNHNYYKRIIRDDSIMSMEKPFLTEQFMTLVECFHLKATKVGRSLDVCNVLPNIMANLLAQSIGFVLNKNPYSLNEIRAELIKASKFESFHRYNKILFQNSSNPIHHRLLAWFCSNNLLFVASICYALRHHFVSFRHLLLRQ